MPVNLQQHTRTVGNFNSCFNHNNIHSSVFHRKLNVSSIPGAYFAILTNFCTFCQLLTNKQLKLCLSICYQLIWFMLRFFLLGKREVEILKRTLNLNLNLVIAFLFGTGISTAFRRKCLSNYLY